MTEEKEENTSQQGQQRKQYPCAAQTSAFANWRLPLWYVRAGLRWFIGAHFHVFNRRIFHKIESTVRMVGHLGVWFFQDLAWTFALLRPRWIRVN
jgi:hypothetical protein